MIKKIQTPYLTALLLFFSWAITAKPLNVMVLTGHTDKFHDWKISSQYVKKVLDQQQIFKTDLVVIPQLGPSFKTFVPNFEKYDVVVLKLNIPDWNAKAKTALENFVKSGGGVVVLHEAGNAFIHWLEYNKMTALGGWGRSDAFPKWVDYYQLSEKEAWPDRNERCGPYYYWKANKFVTDSIPGHAGAHGNRVPYVIQVRDTAHAITKGLPKKWLQFNDELYGDLRGPAQNITVLATAFSEKKSGGTGKEEPVFFTVKYGKGRIFHSVMGHTNPRLFDSLHNVGFQVTFSRGVEWAATGNVTQSVPKHFPTDTTVLLKNLFPIE